ncbi:MAG: rRNA methyltransferase [Spirochaetaceae bacterium]|jgi:hypothetical protein|nr:rRNA methyltransferase [Spirochaetaceae bacterium]
MSAAGYLFPGAGAEQRRLLARFPALVDRVFPLPGRFLAALPRDVAELSRLLTSGRGDRHDGYLGRPELLSAYLRYFLPWNLYRLYRLLPALPLNLADGDLVVDLGSGPLTLVLALWLFRPGLRDRSLEFRCIDRTGAVLDAGKRLFAALAGSDSPWRIKTIRASLGAPVKGPRAALVSAVNVFNETWRSIPEANAGALRLGAEKNARLLSSLAAESGSILVVEPGVPRSGEFIAALRAALIECGYPPRLPCPHAGPCPLPGGRSPATRPSGAKGKWCHFGFDTGDAPPELLKLSAAAGIPKDRAVLSFLFAGPGGIPLPEGGETPSLAVRIISDAFPLTGDGRSGRGRPGDRSGRYGCSVRGLVLAAGDRAALAALSPGTLLRIAPPAREKRDPKSGALMAELPPDRGPY